MQVDKPNQQADISADQHTLLCKQAEQDILSSGKSADIGTMPVSLYKKLEYSDADSLYLYMPKHDTLIPYHQAESKLIATIAKVLVDNKDFTSSQAITDYPIITDNHRRIWYMESEVVEVLKTVEVYEPPTQRSDWLNERLHKRRQAHQSVQSANVVLDKLKRNPIYLRSSAEKQMNMRIHAVKKQREGKR